MSTLYGSDAMGGVINLITRKVGDRWAGTLTGELTLQEDGDFGNLYSGNAYLHGPVVPGLIGLPLRGSYLYRGAGVAQDQLGSFKGYELFHLGANYQLTPAVKLSATIYNLFDKDFTGYEPYVTGGGTSYASAYANLMEPRRL